MTLREFRFAIRFATQKGQQPTKVARSFLTPAQLEKLNTDPELKAERNKKKHNPSYWSSTLIRQAWRLAFPGESER